MKHPKAVERSLIITRNWRFFAACLMAAGFGWLPVQLPAQTFKTLHSFAPVNNGTNADGTLPWPALVLVSNTLYGTTYNGGAYSNGTVFAVNTDGTGFTNLHTFGLRISLRGTNSDGGWPVAGLLLSGSTLYGTTGLAGTNGHGTIFAINTDGTGFTNLHNFAGANDGAATTAKLILSGNTLYGASQGGGSNAFGMIFAINTDGSGYTNLYNFPTETSKTNATGGQPVGGLAVSGTNLFGTGWSGGAGGSGTVFRLNTDGSGFTNLHSFAALVNNTNSDGATPFCALTLSGNTLYGTTVYGGATSNGVLFRINTDGSGFTNLHTFPAIPDGTNNDGAGPYGSLFLSGATLYGTTLAGGVFSNGTVFAVNTDGSDFRVWYSFSRFINGTNSDGAAPVSGILSSNTIYGLAHVGGSGDVGTVFSLFIPPPLALAVSGTNAVLDWPTNADGFALQSATNLSPAAVWSQVVPAPVNLNGQFTVTNPVSSGPVFYRLTR